MGDCKVCGAGGSVWDDNLYWGCKACGAGNILTPNCHPRNVASPPTSPGETA